MLTFATRTANSINQSADRDSMLFAEGHQR